MYSREEASRLRQQFWITFGKYMKPVPSSEGLDINWINYKTGVKGIGFKMDVDQKEAIIAIVIQHSNTEERYRYYEQFESFKTLFRDEIEEDWIWERELVDENGNSFSRISTRLQNVSIFNQSQWPDLIAFLKPRIMALDRFWGNVKEVFENVH
ncbi:MAG: DUF4268 domain-containing protein [Pedobacter sp.]|nr:MAG: DUF4268 domain-containing protein [Pedobacter sp.]